MNTFRSIATKALLVAAPVRSSSPNRDPRARLSRATRSREGPGLPAVPLL